MAARPRLSDEQLAELLELIGGADSVELKLTIPASEQRSAVEALDLDALDAEIRQVFFFETPELALFDSGVVVRARRAQRKGEDTVVKLRPVVPAELPDDLRQSPNMVVEVDAMPGGFVCSGSLKRALNSTSKVREVARGTRRISKLFSKEQRAFFTANAPAGVELDRLEIFGPIFVLKLKSVPAGIDRKLVSELWLYPNNTRILELSTKCAPAEAFDVAARTRAFLTERGVDISGEQQTKTRTALEYFSQAARPHP
jgi:hypothetical protein